MRAISGKENKVEEYINNALVSSSLFREYVSQVLIPREKVVTLKNGKRTEKERNLLPGYVLVECYLCDESFPLLRNIPNVLGFLSGGKTTVKPEPVSQAEVNKLVGLASESEVRAATEISFLVGESIKVVDGPFNGFKGTIQEVAEDKHKLKVVVTIFDRQTPLELGYNQVEKEKQIPLQIVSHYSVVSNLLTGRGCQHPLSGQKLLTNVKLWLKKLLVLSNSKSRVAQPTLHLR